MLKELKVILKTALQSMEAGEFQEFSKAILPVINGDYVGLERLGGTVDGKTRPGTPDLIKTKSNAKIIAVQCGTEENYWRAPEDKTKYSEWKPCKDIDDCLNKIEDKLEEIVLCSNREIPVNKPETKSEIIAYLKKEGIKITLYDLPAFETSIETAYIKDPQIIYILKNFLPSVSDLLDKLEEGDKNKDILELTKSFSLPLSKIEAIVTEAYKFATQEEKRAEIINEKISQL